MEVCVLQRVDRIHPAELRVGLHGGHDHVLANEDSTEAPQLGSSAKLLRVMDNGDDEGVTIAGKSFGREVSRNDG